MQRTGKIILVASLLIGVLGLRAENPYWFLLSFIGMLLGGVIWAVGGIQDRARAALTARRVKTLLAQQGAEREQQRLSAIEARRIEWGDTFSDAVLARQVQIGMTPDMVRLTWGSPTSTDEQEVNSRSAKERWVYDTGERAKNYVWFSNGKVTKIKT